MPRQFDYEVLSEAHKIKQCFLFRFEIKWTNWVIVPSVDNSNGSKINIGFDSIKIKGENKIDHFIKRLYTENLEYRK